MACGWAGSIASAARAAAIAAPVRAGQGVVGAAVLEQRLCEGHVVPDPRPVDRDGLAEEPDAPVEMTHVALETPEVEERVRVPGVDAQHPPVQP